MPQVPTDREIIIVRRSEVRPRRYPGVLRQEAFTDPHVWVGRVRNEPGEMSNWHVHPNHVTYAFIVAGRLRVEFGPAGSRILEAEAGDFVKVPPGLIHREGSGGGDDGMTSIGFRVGDGETVVDVDGPEPLGS